MTTEPTKDIIEARRRFLQQCGKFSVATPPAVALLLATADRSYAAALSGARTHTSFNADSAPPAATGAAKTGK
jgi:hypothetical protein